MAMAETAKASVGYGSQFWLKNETALYKLHEVTEFDVPGPAPREQVEKTHLESPGWRREYISTFYEDQDIEVLMNSRPMSDTDVLCEAALAAGDTREFKCVLPENGEPTTQIEGTCRVIGYGRGRVSKDGLMGTTLTVRIVTVENIAAYVAPGGGD